MEIHDMNDNVKVSVIIPVYNSEMFLEECLSSVVNQTLNDIEIICVDDGSTDGSMNIIKKYQNIDYRIQVIKQPNRGAGEARNVGMARAKGEYLSFLDSDDFFEKDMLKQAYTLAKKNDADVCVFKSDLYDISTKQYSECSFSFRKEYFNELKVFSPKEYPYNENIFRMFNGWPWDKIYKRQFIEESELTYQNLKNTNDMYFVMMALAKADRIITLAKCLIHHRKGISSSISNTRELSWDCFYIGLKAMKSEMLKSGIYDIYKRAFLNWTLHLSLWQLNTMKSVNAYSKVYTLLRDVVFKEFRVTEAKEDDFYNKDEYEQYMEIMKYPIDEYFVKQLDDIKELKIQNRVLLNELNNNKSSISYRLGLKITWLPRKVCHALSRY
jgi:glycosyltransferase involved in cell wall biosynthesis